MVLRTTKRKPKDKGSAHYVIWIFLIGLFLLCIWKISIGIAAGSSAPDLSVHTIEKERKVLEVHSVQDKPHVTIRHPDHMDEDLHAPPMILKNRHRSREDGTGKIVEFKALALNDPDMIWMFSVPDKDGISELSCLLWGLSSRTSLLGSFPRYEKAVDWDEFYEYMYDCSKSKNRPCAYFTGSKWPMHCSNQQKTFCEAMPECPCDTYGKPRCLSLKGSCSIKLPRRENGKFVQITRDPYEQLASMYLDLKKFHHRIGNMKKSELLSSMKDKGYNVPQRWIEELLEEEMGDVGLLNAVRNLDTGKALELVFWMHVDELYQSARLSKALDSLPLSQSLQVTKFRSEDLQKSFPDTAITLLNWLSVDGKDVSSFVDFMSPICDVTHTNKESEESSRDEGKDGSDAIEGLVDLLASNERIGRHLCVISEALGYTCP
eukprot:jgi/Picsp_1/6011/NSC_03365-R1_---NA---